MISSASTPRYVHAVRREVRVDERLRVRRERADRLRKREQRRREDDRDDARHVHAQRHVGRAAGRLAPPDHPLRVLDRDAALALLHEHDRDDDADRDQREEELLERAAVDPRVDARRGRREDRREDQQRDAVADAALRDQLAHPHEERRAGGERDDDQHEPARVRRQRALRGGRGTRSRPTAPPRGRRSGSACTG